jgi:hypothetical protein
MTEPQLIEAFPFTHYGEWKEVRAWKSIMINDEKYWLKKVWRRFVYNSDVGSYWEYITEAAYLAIKS